MPTPRNNNYSLGRGELHLAPFDGVQTQKATNYRYLGNTPDFSLNVSTTDLDHFSSDRGLKTRDATITLQVNRTAGFTVEDISLDNVALFFFGQKQTNTTTVTTVTGELQSSVKNDTTRQLGVTATNPAGARNLSGVTSVTDDTTPTPITYQTPRDYVPDLTTGRIYIVATTAGGTIADGKNLKVTYGIAALSNDQVISGATQVEGAMQFIASNPVGANIDYFLPWVKVSPDGDYTLKTDSWQNMKFKVMILDPKDGRAAVYANGRPYATS